MNKSSHAPPALARVVALVAIIAALPAPRLCHAQADPADAAYERGARLVQQRDYHAARPSLEKAIRLYRQSGLGYQEAWARNNLGIALIDAAEFGPAAAHLNAARALFARNGDVKGEADTVLNLSKLAYCRARDDEARRRGDEARRLYRKLRDTEGEAKALVLMGLIEQDAARYSSALDYYDQAFSASKKLGQKDLQIYCVNNRGLVAEEMGEYDLAARCFESSLRISTRKDRAGAYYNLANLAERLADHGKAERLYGKAMTLYRDLGCAWEQADVLRKLGALAANTDRPETAEALYKQARDLYLRKSLLKQVRETSRDLADLAIDTERPAAARAWLAGDDDPVHWGRYFLLARRPDKAREWFEKDAGRGRNASWQIAREIGLGRALEGLGELAGAGDHYTRAVNLLEQSRENAGPADRGFFFSGKELGFSRLDPYEGLVRIRHRQGRNDAAFLGAESTKARALTEALARRPHGVAASLPPALRRREDELTNRIAALGRKIEARPMLQMALEKQLAPLRAEHRALIDRLYKERPEYASMKYPRPLPPGQIALRPGEALIEYEVTETETLVFVLLGEKSGARVVDAFEIPISRRELTSMVLRYRECFQKVSTKLDLKDARVVSLGNRLYAELLGPALRAVPPGASVLVVPDEVLGLLPFDALVSRVPEGELQWGRTARGFYPIGVRYAGDERVFSCWQSSTALTILRRRAPLAEGDRMLIVGDPIFSRNDPRIAPTRGAKAPGGAGLRRVPLSADLVAAMRALHGPAPRVLSGPDAREGRLRREPLDRYAQILIVTHGMLDLRTPYLQQPALVLGQIGNGPGEDGYLTMSEVMGLKLRADLVALLACQTGVGGLVGGEGVMEMGRALQFAGARSVLVSLWSVEAKCTDRLGERVFAGIRRGESKDEALLAARRELRAQGYEHPFYWAGFVLVGERDGPKPPRPSPWPATAAALALALTAWALYRRTRKPKPSRPPMKGDADSVG